MGNSLSGPQSIDEYIASSPEEVRPVLQSIRATVRKVAPQAEERISYRMPAVFQNGAVVYYAAFKRHIGLYSPVEDAQLMAQVARFAGPKGNLQFPYSQPIPCELIAAVAATRLRANLARGTSRTHGSPATGAKRPRSGEGGT
jgi:uncharacterized protein YdhG (YjbR/CyaY superfamily)